MIQIDGSIGEGGGQILRTSIAMSAITQTPVRIFNIRAKRRNPGLRAQHLHAIKSVKNLCNARVINARIGSTEIEFIPNEISGGRFNIDVGTAGSVTLVLQALMLPALVAKDSTIIKIRGGTDVKWSPPIDYLRFVTLPILRKFGYNAEIELIRRGYYPTGGGMVRIKIEPSSLERIELMDKGKILCIGGISHAHLSLKNSDVAKRLAMSARSTIYDNINYNIDFIGNIRISEEYVNSDSVGAGITLWAETENSRIGSSSIGEKGKRAETVGREAGEFLSNEIKSDSGIDRFMGDQIVPYIALAGGRVRVSKITKHAETNIEIIKKFGFDINLEGNIIESKGFC
ncbi:MAG: RNA 3'-phosphate cyclase [Candidatus Altiarchaeales archaeon]|nr:MAG: RNA 3'-phosphate cyclase [Candidatus Altiarchaeales archaeon]